MFTRTSLLYNLIAPHDIVRIYSVNPSEHDDFPKPVWRNFYDVREVNKWWRNHNV